MTGKIITIEQYLKGKVRNINIPDNTLFAICAEADVDPSALCCEVALRERELCLARLYAWIAGSPTQTGSTKDADGDWEHSDGGERMSAAVLANYLRMANVIFAKYNLPTIGSNKWGMKGSGFHKIRRYTK